MLDSRHRRIVLKRCQLRRDRSSQSPVAVQRSRCAMHEVCALMSRRFFGKAITRYDDFAGSVVLLSSNDYSMRTASFGLPTWTLEPFVQTCIPSKARRPQTSPYSSASSTENASNWLRSKDTLQSLDLRSFPHQRATSEGSDLATSG